MWKPIVPRISIIIYCYEGAHRLKRSSLVLLSNIFFKKKSTTLFDH